jgi:S-formylglutathione hydrolase FrmB
MGGYGAMSIALKHPDIYNAVYSLSAGDLVFDDLPVIFKDDFIAAALAENYVDQPDHVRLIISRAVAYAPHAGALPFPADLPVDRVGMLIDSIWETWLLHDPVSYLSNYLKNPSQLSAIQFDCGLSDMILPLNTHFSEKLTELGIGHTFETYDGDHTSGIKERMNIKVLPFFSEHLQSE